MKKNDNEKQIYELHYKSINEPAKLLAELNQSEKKESLQQSAIYDLCKTRALFVLGETKQAFDLIHHLQPCLEKLNDHILWGKYYLTLHFMSQFSGLEQEKGDEYFSLIEKHTKLSDCKGLACEQKLLNCLTTFSVRSLMKNEELLQDAMRDAWEADIYGLKVEVHIAYAILYLKLQLADDAYRELLLAQDIVEKDIHSYAAAQIFNFLGISHLMKRELEKAESVLTEGIALAREKGYKVQLIPLFLNLGLVFMHQKKLPACIHIYQECLQIINETGMENSENAYKLQDNLARAYTFTGQLEEAIQLMRKSLHVSKITLNKSRENILHVNLADVLIEVEQFEEAEQLLDAAIGYYIQSGNNQYLTNAYLCKARFYEQKQDFKAAFETMELLYQTSQKHFSETFRNQATKHQQWLDNLKHEYFVLKSQCAVNNEYYKYTNDLVGEHPSLRNAVANAVLAARYPYTHVLVTGESGTGKEILAQLVHTESKTAKPLIAVNAGAIPTNLIESELFGHKKGAFTGAIEDKKGKFLLAHNGTLFLDEISELPLEAQAKLLRAIETQTIQPLGSNENITVKCRIISTTNCNIKDLIRKNKFRLDLYHRLNKVEIYLSPLRERLSDLELLTTYFCQRFSAEYNLPMPLITENFYHRLRTYSFPGNIRELKNMIERIFILHAPYVWETNLLDSSIQEKEQPEYFGNGITHDLNDTEVKLILNALEQSGWVQKDAAKLLNMTESTLTRRIKKYGLKKGKLV
jgi:transcriptional regulator with PAS, ATPase and Fis domain